MPLGSGSIAAEETRPDMLNYLLAAVIASSAAGSVLAWYVLRNRARRRIPSLNSLRDVTRRGAQRSTIRARTDRSSEDALNAMLSDLK
jgi:hypothetical protein